jgi:hypothetical protein
MRVVTQLHDNWIVSFSRKLASLPITFIHSRSSLVCNSLFHALTSTPTLSPCSCLETCFMPVDKTLRAVIFTHSCSPFYLPLNSSFSRLFIQTGWPDRVNFRLLGDCLFSVLF